MADDVPVNAAQEKATEEETPKNEEQPKESPPEPEKMQGTEEASAAEQGEAASSASTPKKITIHVKTPKEKESFEVEENLNIKEVRRQSLFITHCFFWFHTHYTL